MYAVVLILFAADTEADYTHRLAVEYQCESEVVMPDETRCDLVTDTHAIEVEWASKWQEAPGQAILYAIWTGKRPAIVLLVRDYRADKLHILRCKLVCERAGIDLRMYPSR